MKIVKPRRIDLMLMTLVNDGVFVFPDEEPTKPVVSQTALDNRFKDMLDVFMSGALKQSPSYYTNNLNK